MYIRTHSSHFRITRGLQSMASWLLKWRNASCCLALSSPLWKAKNKGKDIFLESCVSTSRSVYQQRVMEANEKNYLIRTTPRWRQGSWSFSLPHLGKLSINVSLCPSCLPRRVQILCLLLRNAHTGTGYSRSRVRNRSLLCHFFCLWKGQGLRTSKQLLRKGGNIHLLHTHYSLTPSHKHTHIHTYTCINTVYNTCI